MWEFIFRLNEIFRIVYVYAYMYTIDCKTCESYFKILIFNNND